MSQGTAPTAERHPPHRAALDYPDYRRTPYHRRLAATALRRMAALVDQHRR